VKYLCLIYDDEKVLEAMPKPEQDAFMGEYFAFTEAVQAGGQYVAGEALHPVATATTVRIRTVGWSPPTARSPRRASSSAAST
jgi:hypothetical protein